MFVSNSHLLNTRNRPSLGIKGQHELDEIDRITGDIRPVRRIKLHFTLLHHGQNLFVLLTIEGWIATEKDVANHTATPNIASNGGRYVHIFLENKKSAARISQKKPWKILKHQPAEDISKNERSQWRSSGTSHHKHQPTPVGLRSKASQHGSSW